MEKMEKTLCCKNFAEYYELLLTYVRGGKCEFVVSTGEISKAVERLASDLGEEFKNKSSSAQYKCTRRDSFLEIFKKYIIETVKDPGKGKTLISFRFGKEDLISVSEKLISKNKRLNRAYKISKTEEKPVEKKAEEKAAPFLVKKGKRVPRKSFMEKFIKLVHYVYSNGGQIKASDVYKLMSYSKTTGITAIVDNWRETLSVGYISLKVSKLVKVDKKIYLSFENPMALLSDLRSRYKSWYGIEAPYYEMGGKTVPRETIEHTTVELPKKEKEEISFLEAYMIFATGGICFKTKTTVEFNLLVKTLREKFGIASNKAEILEVIKDNASEYFTINTSGTGIQGLKLKEVNSWVEIKDYFNPRNFKKTCYMRVGLSLEDVIQHIPECIVETVSTISASDNIFKVTYDRSEVTLRKLVDLRRTFRGTDILLDETLEKRLCEIIKIQNEEFYTGLAYDIEIL